MLLNKKKTTIKLKALSAATYQLGLLIKYRYIEIPIIYFLNNRVLVIFFGRYFDSSILTVDIFLKLISHFLFH